MNIKRYLRICRYEAKKRFYWIGHVLFVAAWIFCQVRYNIFLEKPENELALNIFIALFLAHASWGIFQWTGNFFNFMTYSFGDFEREREEKQNAYRE